MAADGEPAETDYGPVTRDAVLAEAIRLHDLHYGNAHCDRKYVQVCPRLLPLIYEAGQNLRSQGSS